ncbi:MAG: hypothetical protein R2715_20040 [Ilumatobacteraceae bacterium]
MDANGAVIDDYIQYQFEGVSAYNATTNADGQVVFPLENSLDSADPGAPVLCTSPRR